MLKRFGVIALVSSLASAQPAQPSTARLRLGASVGGGLTVSAGVSALLQAELRAGVRLHERFSVLATGAIDQWFDRSQTTAWVTSLLAEVSFGIGRFALGPALGTADLAPNPRLGLKLRGGVAVPLGALQESTVRLLLFADVTALAHTYTICPITPPCFDRLATLLSPSLGVGLDFD